MVMRHGCKADAQILSTPFPSISYLLSPARQKGKCTERKSEDLMQRQVHCLIGILKIALILDTPPEDTLVPLPTCCIEWCLHPKLCNALACHQPEQAFRGKTLACMTIFTGVQAMQLDVIT